MQAFSLEEIRIAAIGHSGRVCIGVLVPGSQQEFKAYKDAHNDFLNALVDVYAGQSRDITRKSDGRKFRVIVTDITKNTD